MSQDYINILEDSSDQIPSLSSHDFQVEDSYPLFQTNQTTEETVPVITQQQTINREQNAYKIADSAFHKTLKSLKSTTTKKFQDLLRQVISKSNKSTSLKLIALAQRAGLVQSIQSTFSLRAQQSIEALRNKKQWSQQRHQAVEKQKDKFARALREKVFKKRFEIIWANNNHPGKQAESLDAVKEFMKKISKIRKSQLVKSHAVQKPSKIKKIKKIRINKKSMLLKSN